MKRTLGRLAFSLLFTSLIALSASPAYADSPSVKLADIHSSSGGVNPQSPVPSATSGMAFCIGYGDTGNYPFVPLPLRPLQTTLGCDREFFSGQPGTFDYDATNSADFNAFVQNITNATDDQLSLCEFALTNDGTMTVPSSCGSNVESYRLFAYYANPGDDSPTVPPGATDLHGNVIDKVRLIVNQVQAYNSGTTNYAGWDLDWQIWGHPIPTNAAPTISPISAATINQGSTYASAGSFTDSDSTSWTATVDYGDGSGTQPLTLSGANFSLSHQYTNVGIYSVTVNVIDNQSATGTATSTITVQRQLVALQPAKVWISKGLLNIGVKFDLLAQAYVNNTLVSSGQINSATAGSGGFNNATLETIPFNSFSPVYVPPGSAVKMTVSVRTACTGSLLNMGNARLWYNDTAANSQFGATIGSSSNNYFLLDNLVLGIAEGTGPRREINIAAGTRCSAFKSFGTWTLAL